MTERQPERSTPAARGLPQPARDGVHAGDELADDERHRVVRRNPCGRQASDRLVAFGRAGDFDHDVLGEPVELDALGDHLARVVAQAGVRLGRDKSMFAATRLELRQNRALGTAAGDFLVSVPVRRTRHRLRGRCGYGRRSSRSSRRGLSLMAVKVSRGLVVTPRKRLAGGGLHGLQSRSSQASILPGPGPWRSWTRASGDTPAGKSPTTARPWAAPAGVVRARWVGSWKPSHRQREPGHEGTGTTRGIENAAMMENRTTASIVTVVKRLWAWTGLLPREDGRRFGITNQM